MAPADVLFTALAAAAAVAPTTTGAVATVAITTHTTGTTLDLFTNTFLKTLTTVATTTTSTTRTATPTATTATTTSTSLSVNGGACWPGPCSPYMAVSFGPFSTTDNSRFVSEWGGAAFAGAFGLLTILHLVQGCYYRLWKVATAAVAGGLAAFAGYTMQAVASHQRGYPTDTDNVQPYLLATAFVLLQIAPLCITLVPYLTLNRLAGTRFVPAHDSLPDTLRKPWPSNGRWVAAWPVWALLVVAAGAQAAAVAFLVYCGLTTTSAYDIPRALLVAADLVWAGGLAAQGLVVLVLLGAVTQAYATLPPARPGGQQERSEAGTVRPSLPPRRRRQIVWLLGTTYGVLALVVMRVVYRTVVAVTAAEGKSTTTMTTSTVTMQPEAAATVVRRVAAAATLSRRTTTTSSSSSSTLYALVLDALPTFLALLLLCACHAGWALPATEARHPAPGSGGSREADAGDEDDRLEVEERMDALHDLDSPLERRVYFGQAQGGQADMNADGAGDGQLSTEQVLLQQRAALQQHYRLRQRQQDRERDRHPPPPPVVEALARFSLSASLSVSLPRESFVSGDRGERLPRPPVPGELDEVAGGAPQRLLARLSMDNFILFRFLNTPSRSTSGRHTIPQSARSGAPSRAASQSHGGSHGYSHGDSHADDPFAGFDDVAQAGLQNEEAAQGHLHDNDSHRTCDSPDEKEKGGPPAWP